MELLNATGMQAGYTMGVEPGGREHLVIAVKGTFSIPSRGQTPRLTQVQVPLIEADTFTGEPGHSAPVYEADYPLHKPRCDVLLIGSAYAPEGKPVERLQVGVKVAAMSKTLHVIGDRLWMAGDSIKPSAHILPFKQMPISYDRAFGGVDNFHKDPSKHTAFGQNPIGRGFHSELDRNLVDGTPMPNTEELNRPIERPNGHYRPMAFGPVGRGWTPRLQFAGTYDQDWLDNCFPFLPADFQDDYNQSAPTDQQIPYPKGGEEVVLLHLTPDGRRHFRLPRVEVPIIFFRKQGRRTETKGVIDNILLEPDKGIFTMTWRSSIPLQKNLFEIPQVLAGHMTRAWWRARELGKIHYPSLAAAYRAKHPPEDTLESDA